MSELLFKPKFKYTDKMVNLTADAAENANTLMYTGELLHNPLLRRANRIKSIHSSLAIENNSLTLEQVTDVINGIHVFAPPEEICEVKNAFKAYERVLRLNPYNSDDLEVAQGIMMRDLVRMPGQFRNGNVGIIRGNEVIHIAPPADMVSGLIADLLLWVKKAKVHPLIKSCIFHYEFEFIHPFPDGNGRMGRMWQTLLLYKWKEVFAWLPVETMIKENQQGYYKAITNSNDNDDCTEFIEFMLTVILKAIKKEAKKQKEKELAEQNAMQNPYDNNQENTRDKSEQSPKNKEIEKNISPKNIRDNHNENIRDNIRDNGRKTLLLMALKNEELSANELMQILRMSNIRSFKKNYIQPAIKDGLIEMTIPDKPSSRNQKYRKISN